MNTTIHNVPLQQTEFIPSQGIPIIERQQGYPGGHGQGHPPENLETTKDTRWSSHGVYYGTPKWKHWDIQITPTPELKAEKAKLERTIERRLMMSFVYVWCILLIVFGIFYYANRIQCSTFSILIAVVTLALLFTYGYILKLSSASI